MQSDTKRVSLFNYGLLVMALTHTLTHVFTRIHPALFPVFRVEFGLTLQQLGIIAAIPPLCSTILTLPSGFLTDKFGSRTILIICFLTSGIAAVVISLSINLIMLTLSISAVILTSALYHTASYTYVSKLFSEKDRSKALGIQGAGGPLGMSLGPLSLTMFVGILGWKWRSLYFFWALPVLAIIIALWRLKPIQNFKSEKGGSKKKAGKVQESQKNYKSLLSVGLITFLISGALRMFSDSMLETFVPTYLHDVKGLTVSQAGLIYGSISLMGVVSAPLGGYLADRFGNKQWLMSAIIINTLCLITASITPSVFSFTIFYLLYGFFNSSGMAANSSIVAKLTPSGRRGMGFALFFLPGSLMGFFAPIVGAIMAEVLELSFLFPISVIIKFIGLIVLKFGVKLNTKIDQ